MLLQRTCFALLAVLGSLALGVAAEPKEDKLKISAQEQLILDEANAVRKKNQPSLPALKPNSLLFKAARGHSNNMNKHKPVLTGAKEEHILDGKDPGQRIDDAGYKWVACGENLGFMTKFDKSTVEGLFKNWLKSQAHARELLSRDYEETGIGVVEGTDRAGKKGFWITQVFGTEEKK